MSLDSKIMETMKTAMKRSLLKIIFLMVGIMVATIGNAQNKIDFSSVDEFFKLTNKLETGIEPTNEEWTQLLDTHGYYCATEANSPLVKKVVRRMMNAAFNPNYKMLRDSISSLSNEEIMNNSEFFLSKRVLENYLDMKNHLWELKKFRDSAIFQTIKSDSKERLKTFLINPVDSLIKVPSINILCFDADGFSTEDGIILDLNLMYKLSYAGTVNFLAHEMFHTYRRNFVNQNFTYGLSEFTDQLNHLQDEGIADLIDKKENAWESPSMIAGMPKPFLNKYAETYKNTPRILARLDSITCSFLDNKITKEQFADEMKNFFFLSGHPNGYYMSKLIKNAGFESDLKKTFYNPVAFIQLYNKVAKKRGEYVFSKKFMDYIEKMQ